MAINGTNVEGKGIKEVAPLMADVLILSLDCRVHEDAAEPPSSIDGLKLLRARPRSFKPI